MWLCPYQCIETDETARKPDQIKMPLSSEEERDAITHLEQAIATDRVTPGMQILNISFFFFLRLKETQADWQIENVKAGVLHLWLTIGVCVL